MNNFLTIENIEINLNKVSHVIFNDKIIINFDHSIILQNGKKIPNYLYLDIRHKQWFEKELTKAGFKKHTRHKHLDEVYINYDKVSTIKRTEDKMIFNMCFDVDNGNKSINPQFKTVSEFINVIL